MQELFTELSGKSHVIWDWNGTLLDDVGLCIEVMAAILSEQGMAPIDLAEYRRHFRFPVRDYYRDLGFDFERLPFEQLSARFVTGFNDRVVECSLFDGCVALLTALGERGVGCSILSAAQQQHLEQQLSHHGIRHHFREVYGIADFHAHGKLQRGHELIARLGVPAGELVLIGDTDHDLEVGRALGIDVVLLEGGHQCADRLAALHPRVVRRAGATR